MRDCHYERHMRIGNFEGRDSGNSNLNAPRTGSFRWREFIKRLFYVKVLKSLASHAAVFMRSCLTSFHKRVYNLVSPTTIEVESAHSVVNLLQRSTSIDVNLRKKLWKCSQRSLKEDNPLGGVLFLQIQSLCILYPNLPWSCRPHRYSNYITCTNSTTEYAEHEGLGANILVLRCVRWKKLELSRRTSIREKFSQVNRSASNCLTSRSSKKKKKRQTKGKMRY